MALIGGDLQESTFADTTENKKHISEKHVALGTVLFVFRLDVGLVRQQEFAPFDLTVLSGEV